MNNISWRPFRATFLARATTSAGLVLVCLALAGCAAQNSFKSGKDLMASGRLDEGLEKLKAATDMDRTNVEFRSAYLRARELALQTHLQQADALLSSEKYADARRRYLDAQNLEPGNQRASIGINNVEIRVRHRDELKEIDALIAAQQLARAASALRAMITEDPLNSAASARLSQIEERPSTSSGDSALAASFQKPITIEFRDASLRQIFEVISRTSGLNFLFDKDVKSDQVTSIFLKNSNVESAVYLTLLTNHLEQRVLDSNTILIFPNSPSKLLEYQEMVIKTFFLTNADAKTVAATLKTILKAKDIVTDEKLNMLIMRDSVGVIRMAEKLVALQDVAEPEVMLEVEILEVKRLRLQELGIKWPESLTLTPLSSAESPLTLRDLRSGLNSASIGAALSPVVINANVQDSDANILANPRIRARNREKAKILIGERVPNVTTTSSSSGFVSESINYLDVGLKLDVEPTVYLDNDVSIKIAMEVSSVVGQTLTKGGSLAYQIGTRTASTVLRLKDGETQILAGLINAEERSNGNKVPGIGELPIVGRLFGSTADNSQKTEIVLSITPRLIRNIRRPSASQSEFFSGTDGNFRTRTQASAPQSSVVPSVATRNLARPDQPSAMAIAVPPSTTGGPAPGTTPAASAFGSDSGSIGPGATKSDTTGSSLGLVGPAAIKKGDTFVLDLAVQAKQPIAELPVTLVFDPKVLRVTTVVEGDFLNKGGAQSDLNTTIDPGGRITIKGGRSAATGANGTGVLASLTFLALEPSKRSEVRVLELAPTGKDRGAISMPIPSPHTFKVE